ncbi:transposase [Streptomyces erythrochromogenes]|uniref:transposase n=1 Tax=Streptomyces erythrochromogenes TaxID=285574 RepID=UPI0036BE20C9
MGPDTAAQLLITSGANPARLRTEAAFAALCGAAPVPASSGKTNRHRLSRGGDRAANAALYRIALVRMARCRHPRVRRPTDRRRTHEKGDHPAAQTRDSPRGLPAPDHPGPSPRDRGPPSGPADEEHHSHRRRQPLRRVARRHLQHRTRPPPRRRLRRCLPPMTHHRLTDDRSIKALEGMADRRTRPPDPICPVLFVNCVNMKIRDGAVANRPIYVASRSPATATARSSDCGPATAARAPSTGRTSSPSCRTAA